MGGAFSAPQTPRVRVGAQAPLSTLPLREAGGCPERGLLCKVLLARYAHGKKRSRVRSVTTRR